MWCSGKVVESKTRGCRFTPRCGGAAFETFQKCRRSSIFVKNKFDGYHLNFFRHLCELVLRHQMRVSNYFVNSFYSVATVSSRCWYLSTQTTLNPQITHCMQGHCSTVPMLPLWWWGSFEYNYYLPAAEIAILAAEHSVAGEGYGLPSLWYKSPPPPRSFS